LKQKLEEDQTATGLLPGGMMSSYTQ